MNMSLDFTLAKYGELCNTIVQSGYDLVSVKDYLSLSLSLQPLGKVIILRYDVDRKPENALQMAEIERELGISGTYYFRSPKEVFKAEIMHEIGYHYEVLDKAKGNFDIIGEPYLSIDFDRVAYFTDTGRMMRIL